MKIKAVWSIPSFVLIAILAGCDKAPNGPARGETAAAPQAAAVVAKRERFDGFSFELPNGWSRVTPDGENTQALLLFGGERRDSAKAMIKVDVGTPASKNPKTVAASLAQDFGGNVQPEPADLDGARGVQVLAPPAGSGLSSKNAIVVIRHGELYLIIAGAVAGTDISDALEQVRKSWKWDK
jgi:hypothetical protein